MSICSIHPSSRGSDSFPGGPCHLQLEREKPEAEDQGAAETPQERLWKITTKPVKISQTPVDADEIHCDCSAVHRGTAEKKTSNKTNYSLKPNKNSEVKTNPQAILTF